MDEAIIQTFSLAGRVAVVTGGASGIGRETARVMAEAGASVAVSDINEAGLAETVHLVEATGQPCIAQTTDVAQRRAVMALADRVMREWGRIDVWVNAAGALVRVPIHEASEEQINRLLDINLKGVYWGCVAARNAMEPKGAGSIINISSGGGETPNPELAIYAMTKAGVNMLTRTAAKEFGPLGIRVNAIAPGWIDTPLANIAALDSQGQIDPAKRAELIRVREQASPLGLTGVPRDIALAALYLASDASRFVTGQNLRPNGGVSMP
jgi:3-oxoacyl-[acyl-carrier protein] reductase